jgi:hypothetical protein
MGAVVAQVCQPRPFGAAVTTIIISEPAAARRRSPTIALRVVHCRCVSQIIQVLLIFMLPGLLLPVVLLVVLVMTRSAVGVVVVHVAIIVVLLGMIALLGMMR